MSSSDGFTEHGFLTKHWKLKEARLVKRMLLLQTQLEAAKQELRNHHMEGFREVTVMG